MLYWHFKIGKASCVLNLLLWLHKYKNTSAKSTMTLLLRSSKVMTWTIYFVTILRHTETFMWFRLHGAWPTNHSVSIKYLFVHITHTQPCWAISCISYRCLPKKTTERCEPVFVMVFFEVSTFICSDKVWRLGCTKAAAITQQSKSLEKFWCKSMIPCKGTNSIALIFTVDLIYC